MNDPTDETDQTLEPPPAAAVDSEDGQGLAAGDEPSADDYLKAAAEGARNLKELENMEP